MSRGERFTKRAKEIMTAAQAEAETAQSNTIETPHMLLAMLKVEGSLAQRVLSDLNLEYDRVLSYVRAALPAEPVPKKPATLGMDTRRLLESAMQIARDRRDPYIGSEHVLLALVKGDDKSIRYLMRQINLEPQFVRQNIDRELERKGGDDASISDSDPTASQTLRALTPTPAPEFNARARVLSLVEAGKISAGEGAELLKAMRFAAVPLPGVLVLAVIAFGCNGSPSSPSPVTGGPPPGVTVTPATWQGTLTRDGVSATVRITAPELSPPQAPPAMYGPFEAAFPAVVYRGNASGVTEGPGWLVTLSPTSHGPCGGGAFAFVQGTTQMNLSADGNRLTGTANVSTCEGSVRWQAEFERRR